MFRHLIVMLRRRLKIKWENICNVACAVLASREVWRGGKEWWMFVADCSTKQHLDFSWSTFFLNLFLQLLLIYSGTPVYKKVIVLLSPTLIPHPLTTLRAACHCQASYSKFTALLCDVFYSSTCFNAYLTVMTWMETASKWFISYIAQFIPNKCLSIYFGHWTV